MSFGEFDLFGDMGRADSVTHHKLLFKEVEKAIEVLETERAKPENRHKFLRYAIEFQAGAVKMPFFDYMKSQFPKGIEWYETNGMRSFNIIGASGGLQAKRQICYVISIPEEQCSEPS